MASHAQLRRVSVLLIPLAGVLALAAAWAVFTQQEGKAADGEAAAPAVSVQPAAAAPAAESESAIEEKKEDAAYTAPVVPGHVEVRPDGPSEKPGGPPGEAGKPPKPGEAGKPGEGKPEEPKPEEGPKPVTRPAEPPKPPNPEELKARPSADGKLRFNFRGQPWPEVLQWLADISGMSLDWQEAPGDYLNLVTQESYTVEEARNLINQHLFVRGFTMIRRGEVLMVVNLKKLDPGMVPRVAPEELATRDPYEFVKACFALDWLMADDAAEELKPLLSSYGKITPLVSMNRVEAMDAVVNLREMYRVIEESQSAAGEERLVRVFPLQYTKAADVCQQLEALLGVEKKPSAPMGMNPDQLREMQQQQQQQMMMMAQMQERQPGGPKPPSPPKAKSEVSLVPVERTNCILARATPDKMAIIQQAVEALDAPLDNRQSLLANMTRMHVYRLAAIDPEPLVKTLQEVGNLDPATRLEVDKKNRAIIAYATLADQVTINAVIEKLDGSGRHFDVIPLRRLEADYVAGTIEFMMVGKKEPATRRPPWYDPWDSRSREQPENDNNQFRVDADLENNQLLLWANDIELEEVRQLLVKLGEIPPEGGDPSTVRALEPMSDEETEQLLEAIRRRWPSVAPNRLETPPPLETPKSSPAAEPAEPLHPTSSPTAPGVIAPPRRPGMSASAATSAPVGPRAMAPAPAGVVPVEAPAEPVQPPPTPPPAEPPPVSITRGPDGRLIISSRDTKALDLMEQLAAQLSPPRTDYKIFRLKYAWAYGVALTLEDIFAEEDKKDSRRMPPWYYWDYGTDQSNQDKDRTRLSRRRPVKFISDSDTNSVLVQNADPQQLKKIDELVKFYDQPPPADAQSLRQTELFAIRWAKAAVIADAVKDVYRDLLSSNDKALVNLQQQQRERPRDSYLFLSDGSSEDKEQRVPKFKGLLSVGVDEGSNTLVVSAPAYLMVDIRKLITDLDKAAEPAHTTVEVLKLGRGVPSSVVRQALANAFGETGGAQATPGATPPAGQTKPKAPGQPERHGQQDANQQNR